MDAKIFRINYKSDFILTLESDAGWMTPFCIKFWTGAPAQAYYVGWDGTTYDHCSFDPSEPTKLQVQFDDHHLPVGDLKYQVAYHFTVADFPNDTEDEVLNQANITTEIDGDEYQVMLDFTGETAPEIQFSLPAYANEAQRIANEAQRIAAEQTRIANEETRIANEQTRINQEQARQQNEQQRINQEQARVNEYAALKADAVAATGAANDAAALANQKAQLAADKAALADAAATLANAKAQLAADKAALAASAAQLANDKAALAQQKAEYANTQGGYAKDQGDYAKDQGDYAKAQGDTALADHQRAESDHGIAVDDHTQAGNDHTRAESDHGIATADHTLAAADHVTAGNDHTTATSDHGIASADHTLAAADHAQAESDHTRAESDHAAVEVYVDSLGAYDISAANASGGVLATYADLTAALGTGGANIPELIRKGGMSVKFVRSSDNSYVQYRFLGATTDGFTTVANWERYNDITTSNQSFSDLDFSDEQGNVVVRFKDGNIKTKNFDSSKNATESKSGLMSENDKSKLDNIEQGAEVNNIGIEENETSDLDFSDEDDNVLARFKNGHIRTKNFDSSKTVTESEISNILDRLYVQQLFDSSNAVVYVKDFKNEQNTDDDAISDALVFAFAFDYRTIVLDFNVTITKPILLSSNTKFVINNCIIKQDDYMFDNVFRGANVVLKDCYLDGDEVKWNDNDVYYVPEMIEKIYNVSIVGVGNAQIEGCTNNAYIQHPTLGLQQATGDYYGIRTHQINFSMLENFEIANINFSKSRCWTMCLELSRYGSIHDISINTGDVKNGDGVDIRYGCSDIHIYNITANTQDDGIACTASLSGVRNTTPYPHGNYMLPSQSSEKMMLSLINKDITISYIHDIIIENIVIEQKYGYNNGHGMICLASGGAKVEHIYINNVKETSSTENKESLIKIYSGYGSGYTDGDLNNIRVNDASTTHYPYVVQSNAKCDNMWLNKLHGGTSAEYSLAYPNEFIITNS